MIGRRIWALGLVMVVVFLLLVPAAFAAKPGGKPAKANNGHATPGVAEGVGKKAGQASKAKNAETAPGVAKGLGKVKAGPADASSNAVLGSGKVGTGGQAGKSNTAHLALVAVVECPMYAGAWGKITYKLTGSTLDFVMNAHAVRMAGAWQPDPDSDVLGSTAARTAPPMGGVTYELYAGEVSLGSAAAHGSGNVHIQGSVAWSSDLEGAVFELRPMQAMSGEPQECELVLRSGPIGYVYAARAARRAGR